MSDSIYIKIKGRFPDAEISNHSSDLYVVDENGEISSWLRDNYEFNCNVTTFIGARDSEWAGKRCLDIPFAYDPWWNDKKMEV